GSVARAAGFLHEGTQRGHFLIDGRRQDVHLYGRLPSDPQPAEKVRPLPWASDERPWSGR
ncbi:N-acetyltransferase, partial [Micrococcus endophyticus]